MDLDIAEYIGAWVTTKEGYPNFTGFLSEIDFTVENPTAILIDEDGNKAKVFTDWIWISNDPDGEAAESQPVMIGNVCYHKFGT